MSELSSNSEQLEYTPNIWKIRSAYRIAVGGNTWVDGQAEELDAQFDRWLAQVKAEVWDECGQDIHGDHYPDTETYLRNPYREETE